MWTLILFGDYVAYYLAMAYGMDQPHRGVGEFQERDGKSQIEIRTRCRVPDLLRSYF